MNLDDLTFKLVDNLQGVLDDLDLEYISYRDRFTMSCPIHQGDNKEALSIFVGKKAYIPNWKCFTHSCESEYGKGIYGFFRGVLSTREQKDYSNSETIKWLAKELDITLDTKKQVEFDTGFAKLFGNTELEEKEYSLGALDRLVPYNDKYTAEIIQKYKIGRSGKTGKLRDRIIYPIFNETGDKLIGFSGRSIYSKCNKCNLYHFGSCPTYNFHYYCKWKHSDEFNAANHLYNYYSALPHISRFNTAILVEGVGDVLQLETAGIHCSVAMFGVNFSEQHRTLLEKAGTVYLIVATDSDEAGQQAKKKIEELSHIFEILPLVLPKKDFNDMSITEIHELLKEKKLGYLI